MARENKKIDQDQADENATAALDERIEQVALQGGGALVASITGELLDCFKHVPKPYAQCNQGQQQDIFRRFETLAKVIVQQTAERIAAHDADRSVKCLVGDAKVGSEIKVDLKLAPVTQEHRDAAILFLAHARGRHVVVKMASADEYSTEEPEDPSQPDQADMPFHAGSDEVTDEDLAAEHLAEEETEVETTE